MTRLTLGAAVTETTTLWDKRDDETQKAYDTFLTYRDMGVHRSLEKLRQKSDKKPSYLRQLQRWSSVHEWVDRAEAWDKQQQALIDAAREAKRQSLIDREQSDYERLLEKWDDLFKVAQPLKATRTIKNEDGSVTKVLAVNVGEWVALTKLRREISDIGRRANGMPEKITQSQLTGEDGGKIQVDANIDDLADIFREMAKWESGRQDANPDTDNADAE